MSLRALPFLLVLCTTGFAQTRLTSEEAVRLALEKNHELRLSKNDSAAAYADNTAGNAGMLPSVALSGSDNFQKSTQRLNALDAGIALNWTLFDGGRMFAAKSRLGEMAALSTVRTLDIRQQTVYAVISAYYDVVRQKQQLAALDEITAYNRERVKILETSVNAGLAQKANLLQAKIDLNVYLENSINQQLRVSAAKRALNRFLGRHADIGFEVEDSIPFAGVSESAELYRRMNDSNTTLLAFRKQAEIARLSLKEYKSLHWPRLSLSAGYEFLNKTYVDGLVSQNTAKTARVGGTLTIPLYQGGNTVRQVTIARIEFESAQSALENAGLQVDAQLQEVLEQFEGQQKMLAIERENRELARENLDIAMNRLRLGQSTSLEFKLAEDSFMEAKTRFVNITYSLKLAETRIKQLVSGL